MNESTLIPDRIDTRFWPSILQQTKWRCGFFDFRKAEVPGISYFNCGLVRRPDGLWLVTRRSRNEKNIRIGFNDIVPFLLNENSMQPEFGRKLLVPVSFDREHFEDPRAIYHRGITYVSACNFIVTGNGSGWTGAHQVLLKLDHVSTQEWKVTRRIDPIFGNNGARVGQDKGMEKNWLWFFHEDRLHLLYQASPHQVVRFTDNFEADFVYESGEGKTLPWNYGIVRGGTPPVRVGDEYLTFFHSSLKTNDKYHRRYYMGAYMFEAYPPFRMTRFTTDTLLVGSGQDRWADRKPCVVFPCGSELKDGKWLVTLGVNDLCSAFIQIPHDDLLERMVTLNEPRQKSRFSMFSSKPKLKDVTLVCVDDNKPELAEYAIKECTKGLSFADVKLFTSRHGIKNSTMIGPVRTLDDYCHFIVKELVNHIQTSHVLICQWDGYVLNPEAWKNDWLRYDYIGAPWKLTYGVGNGGFSLRSRKLLEALKSDTFGPEFMPEDQKICISWRSQLEADHHILFAPESVAREFSVENTGYSNQFGFHSFLTKLPDSVKRPKVFHHSGDAGDIIYGLSAIKACGGGALFISPNTKYPVRQSPTYENLQNLIPLLNYQEYIWRASFTGEEVPADYNLNAFRNGIKRHDNLIDRHFMVCGVAPDYKPWLTVDDQMEVSGRPIVISRSSRYHNNLFPWSNLVSKHGKKMIFIGTEKEHSDFIKAFGFVPRASTPTLLDVARLVKGAWTFIGNQSCPMAIALGLGVDRIIQETWDGPDISLGDIDCSWDGAGDRNCVVPGRNVAYVTDGRLDVPKQWFA